MKKWSLILLAVGGLVIAGWLILRFFGGGPVAKIRARPPGGKVPLTVRFTDASENPAGGELQSEWTINGTVVSTEKSFAQQFPSSGIYTATLKVTDARGKSNVTTLAVKVEPRFLWLMAGRPEREAFCVAVNEPNDPDAWADNYLCSTEDFGFQWSSAGPIAGMRCLQIIAPQEPAEHGWDNNYLCVPESSPLELRWSTQGNLMDMPCLQFKEPADPHGWESNVLCYSSNRVGTVQVPTGEQPASSEGKRRSRRR
jgi:PKD repeat protein